MTKSLLLGLDIGGGSGRCLLLDPDSRETTAVRRPWSFAPDPDLPTAQPMQTDRIGSTLGSCVRECLAAAGATPEAVAGLAVTSMRHATALLDRSGAELLVTTNQDARGLVDSITLGQEHGEALLRATGHWPNPVQPAARLRWIARERPEWWERAGVHLSLSDWLAWRLCGETATDPSQASETLLFRLDAREWAWDWVDRLEVPRALLPPVAEPGTRLGRLRADAAADLGLPSDLPVAVGGGDTQCGLLGIGALAVDAVGAVAGTTLPLQWVHGAPPSEPPAHLWSAHHLSANRWVVESNAGAAGTAAEWAAGLLFPDAPEPLLEFLAAAESAPPGAGGVVSTLGAEVMNARAFGLPVGDLTASFMAGGTPSERRANAARAVLEGLAYALRANLEQLEAVRGTSAPGLSIGGGLSRSGFFAQLLCDVLGRPVEIAATAEASALGAALCAGVGAGVYADLSQAASEGIAAGHACEPDSGTAAAYAERFPAWDELRRARSESSGAATGLVMRGMLGGATAPTALSADTAAPSILVTAEMDAAAIERLAALGPVTHRGYKQAMRLLRGESLAEALAGIGIFVTEIDVVDAATLCGARELQVVATCRGNAVNVDVEACTALGIPVLHAPGRNAESVADLTLAFLLMLARRLPDAADFLHEPGGVAGDMTRMGRAFARFQGRELGAQTVGLVGFGAVGRAVAARLGGFGTRCLAHDPFVESETVRRAGVEPVSLATLLAESDFVSLHAPGGSADRPLIGAAELADMRPGAALINTARASLVDADALADALRSGRLVGAALDVFAVEPPAADDPLLALPNVIATPHVGGNTADVAAHQGRIVATGLEQLRAGEAPPTLLNPETLERFRWGARRPAPPPDLVARLSERPAPGITDLEAGSRRRS